MLFIITTTTNNLYLVFHIERLDESAASLLHCTRTAFLGHTQTRVDLRVAPLLL